MFVGIIKKLADLWRNQPPKTLSEEYEKYLCSGYPSNHTYKIRNGKLSPRYKLAKRYKKIRTLFPETLTSLVEIGCSKGFFVFEASHLHSCAKSLGIDVNGYDISVCRWVKEKLQNTRATFEKMQLHTLAEQIEAFGGPFQTVLILNTYQYLYFGSDTFFSCYLDNEKIFQYLRKICSGRIIFNNRMELHDCQNTKPISQSGKRGKHYTEKNIVEAASRYFTVKNHGQIGKYPLLTMDVKE